MSKNATEPEQDSFEPDYITEPGEILQETIENLRITRSELAARIGCGVTHVDRLIEGETRLSQEVSLQLEKATRVPARFWMNLETQYQQRKARLSRRDREAS
ncbi:MAG: HigA family addiction module antitoxin [Planctomycetaceae bacterium]